MTAFLPMQKANNSNGLYLVLGVHIYISKLQWQQCDNIFKIGIFKYASILKNCIPTVPFWHTFMLFLPEMYFQLECPPYLVVPLPGCRGSIHVFCIPDMVKGLVKWFLEVWQLSIVVFQLFQDHRKQRAGIIVQPLPTLSLAQHWKKKAMETHSGLLLPPPILSSI